MKRRIACIVLIAMLCCSSALASSGGTCGDNLTWTLTNSGELIISGTGDMTDYFDGATPWGKDIRTIIISDGVTSVGCYAFNGCTRLTDVRIPTSMKYICEGAFFGCSSLKSIAVPNNMQLIGFVAFEGCSNITSVVIPISMKIIDRWAFSSCENLEDVNYLGTRQQWREINDYRDDNFGDAVIHYGYDPEPSMELPVSLTTIRSEAFTGIVPGTAVYIPPTVRSIADDAFDSSIIIVTSNGSYASNWANNHGYIVVEK